MNSYLSLHGKATGKPFFSTGSVEVEGVSELHTEPDHILIGVDLSRRGCSGTLVQERISPEQGCVLGDLIDRADVECNVPDVAPPRLARAQRLGVVVCGSERHEQASHERRECQQCRDTLAIGRASESTRHTDALAVVQTRGAE